MNAKKCDRCGNFFETSNGLILEYLSEVAWIPDEKYDLCPKCQEEFYKFLNKYKEVIKNEKK